MLYEALRRTRQAFFGRIATLLGATEITDESWEQLEALLIQADVGIVTTQAVVAATRARVLKEGLTQHDQLQAALEESLLESLPPGSPLRIDPANDLNVILVVGVNGSGKTTTVAKLGKLFVTDGWSVMLAAADTFRAAASEQLQKWGERLRLPVVAGRPGGDPGAIVYDAIEAARARGRQLLLVDTAGRLHTKYNLMQELQKIVRVAEKNVIGAPHEVWLVLDGTTGQNALAQAGEFGQAVGVTGAILTKLDSTARGGIIFAIGRELGVPIHYIGVGEGAEDLIPFDAKTFVHSLWG